MKILDLRNSTQTCCLRESLGEAGVGLFSQATCSRIRLKGLKLNQRRFKLGIRKNFSKRVVRPWIRLPREMVESPFKKRIDVVFRGMV